LPARVTVEKGFKFRNLGGTALFGKGWAGCQDFFFRIKSKGVAPDSGATPFDY
jgi:hypothetical protein